LPQTRGARSLKILSRQKVFFICLRLKGRFLITVSKSRAQKQETVNELKDNLARAKAVVFADVQGLKAKELVALRRKIKRVGGILKIAKKTLIDLALKNSGDPVSAVSAKKMKGEVAVLFATQDQLLPLKTLYSFSKENEKLGLLSGVFGNLLLNREQLLELAQLPSREELLSKLIGSLTNPLFGLLTVFQGNIKGLITVLAGKLGFD
jgi:large subunit ribosomal protein L10